MSMEELQSQYKSNFCLAANTLTTFYMNGLQLNQQAYNNGVKKTVDRVNQFLLSQKASNQTVISIDLCLSFLDLIRQDVATEEKGKAVVSQCSTSNASTSRSHNSNEASLDEDGDEEGMGTTHVPATTGTSITTRSTTQSGVSSPTVSNPIRSQVPENIAVATGVNRFSPPIHSPSPPPNQFASPNPALSISTVQTPFQSNTQLQQPQFNIFSQPQNAFRNPFENNEFNSTNNSGSSSTSSSNSNISSSSNTFVFGSLENLPLFTFNSDDQHMPRRHHHPPNIQHHHQQSIYSRIYTPANPNKRNLSDVLMSDQSDQTNPPTGLFNSELIPNKRSRTTVHN